MQYHCYPKKAFSPPFLDTEFFFCREHSKPLWQTTDTIGELGPRQIIEPGFGVYRIQSMRQEFLQRSGHKIRVNTWTGSWERPQPHIKWADYINTIVKKKINLSLGTWQCTPYFWYFLQCTKERPMFSISSLLSSYTAEKYHLTQYQQHFISTSNLQI